MENVYRVKEIIKYRDRDYAVLYTIGTVPYLEYRRDKNHEEHAYNGFVKFIKDYNPTAIVVDERNHHAAMQDKTVRVTIEVGGKTIYQEVEF